MSTTEETMLPADPEPAVEPPTRAPRKRVTNSRKRASKVNVRGAKKTAVGSEAVGSLPGERDKPHANSKHPWDAMRLSYVEGVPRTTAAGAGEVDYPTYQWIADEYGVEVSQIRHKAAAEKWTERRDQAKAAAAAERRRKRLQELAGLSEDIDSRAANMSKLGLTIAASRLSEIAREASIRREWQRQRDLTLQAGGTVQWDEEPDAVDARELETLGRAAETFHKLGRTALGDDVTRFEISGPDGGPITTVQNHLLRDDPNRLGEVLVAMQRSGLIEELLHTDSERADMDSNGDPIPGVVTEPLPIELGDGRDSRTYDPDELLPDVVDVEAEQLYTPDNGYDIT